MRNVQPELFFDSVQLRKMSYMQMFPLNNLKLLKPISLKMNTFNALEANYKALEADYRLRMSELTALKEKQWLGRGFPSAMVRSDAESHALYFSNNDSNDFVSFEIWTAIF